MLNYIININKPAGFTSHDVVNKVRRIMNMKKVGHTGTLDPMATGVLPVCTGKATRITEMLASDTKAYRAKFILGFSTDTQDTSGKITDRREVNISDENIREVISSFIGEIEQIPPMYSAIKHNGRKLYELARSGITVERKPRTVNIYSINIEKIQDDIITIHIECSKGTYIRTLCHDIGERLGTLASMSSLIRTRSGRFDISDAITFDELESSIKINAIKAMRLEDYFDNYDIVVLKDNPLRLAQNGCSPRISGYTEGKIYRVYDDGGRFMSISQMLDGHMTIIKNFYGGTD